MKKPLVLVLTGDGINCENETARAFIHAGADTKILHIEELFQNTKLLDPAQILVFPGGFSYGDELGSGKVLAMKLRKNLKSELQDFIQRGGLILGICNGFQMLVKMGLLPFANFENCVTLTHNRAPEGTLQEYKGGFQDRHVKICVNASPSLWLKDMKGLELLVPIRHGEGRLWVKDKETENKVIQQNLNCLTYAHDVNGSWGLIAGLCDPSGRILGLMPHPEVFFTEDSRFTANQKIFENAVTAAKENL